MEKRIVKVKIWTCIKYTTTLIFISAGPYSIIAVCFIVGELSDQSYIKLEW